MRLRCLKHCRQKLGLTSSGKLKFVPLPAFAWCECGLEKFTMKALFAALVLAAGLLCPCVEAQQYDAQRKEFVERKAKAEQGDARAQFQLGLHYYLGRGVEKDFEEAVKWYRKAAEQGNAYAQFNLGGRYFDGEGQKKDFVEAVKWYRKAAEQGNAMAQFNLGECYADGEGVKKNFVEAYAWLNLAGAAEPEAATNRDQLAERMTPPQIADSQKRTRELRAIVEANAKPAK